MTGALKTSSEKRKNKEGMGAMKKRGYELDMWSISRRESTSHKCSGACKAIAVEGEWSIRVRE